MGVQVAIYAGRGSKRQISAKPIKQIIGRMRPLLQEQRYGEALEGAAVDIGIALAGGSTPGGDGGGPSLRFILALLFCPWASLRPSSSASSLAYGERHGSIFP